PKWAERLEAVSFNALPAALSDDMWTHQYDQMSNQIACRRFPGKPIFRTNGQEAHLFGLEPNYGCCTANFGQGWPKLALSAFMHRGDTVLSALPLPSTLETDALRIRLETQYPFRNQLLYRIDAEKPFRFVIRIPSFAEKLTVNGEARKTEDLSFGIPAGKGQTIQISFETTPRLVDRPNGLKAAKCGSLVFSLPIPFEKKMYEYEKNGVERKYPYCDYELIPTGAWNYGWRAAPDKPAFRGAADTPFSSEQPPVTLRAKMVPVAWDFEDGYETVCAKLPGTEILGGETEQTLVPYGCAKLRMTELPRVDAPT
ncbi:MAG: glycoside hydrolase family 127 protein, partial [Clostridia bacterium]|nr:glycoside hydrolase family 127 protein [Clostridia bacterium]